MDIFQCLIVDDEPLARKLIANYVEKIPNLRIAAQCANAMEAQSCLQNNDIDILFLDIQMPDLSGIDFLKSIPQKPLTIFTTAYSEYALQGFELDVIDYLVKPIAFDRFFQAVQKAFNRIEMKNKVRLAEEQEKNIAQNLSLNVFSTPKKQHTEEMELRDKNETNVDYIFIKVENKLVKINFKDILYIQGMGDYVLIYTTQQKKILTLQSMNKLEELLAEKHFFRIHRSYIINIHKIEELEGNIVKTANQQLPISKRKKNEFIAFLKKYGIFD